ncbi:MAG: hypothetical protein KKD18_05635 [Nanoarchaeota archaeon]|nr:hypothetical protein [Nanoarchaeota archaeon]MBU0977871.1 hypothetical protein [Nanoarchaeota archaeon]
MGEAQERSLVIPRFPLTVLNNGYVSHIVGYDISGIPEFGPYKIGEFARDISEHAKKLEEASIATKDLTIPLYTRFAKFVNTSWDEDATKELGTKDGMLFLLGEGAFPIGCGARDICTIMAVHPGTNNADCISQKIYQDIGTRVKPRATGRIGVDKENVWIRNFTTQWFGNFRDYADVIRSLTRSNISPNDTPILFQATFGRDKEMEFINKYFKYWKL